MYPQAWKLCCPMIQCLLQFTLLLVISSYICGQGYDTQLTATLWYSPDEKMNNFLVTSIATLSLWQTRNIIHIKLCTSNLLATVYRCCYVYYRDTRRWSRLTVMSHKANNKQHTCTSSNLCDHYSEFHLHTRQFYNFKML